MFKFSIKPYIKPILELFPEHREIFLYVERSDKSMFWCGLHKETGEMIKLDNAMPYFAVKKGILSVFPGKKWDRALLKLDSETYQLTGKLFDLNDNLLNEKTIS